MNEPNPAPSSESKRNFLKILFGGSLVAWVGSVLYPVIAYLKPPKQPEVEVSSVMVGPLESLQKGSGTIVRFGNKPVLVVRIGQRRGTSLQRHLHASRLHGPVPTRFGRHLVRMP